MRRTNLRRRNKLNQGKVVYRTNSRLLKQSVEQTNCDDMMRSLGIYASGKNFNDVDKDLIADIIMYATHSEDIIGNDAIIVNNTYKDFYHTLHKVLKWMNKQEIDKIYNDNLENNIKPNHKYLVYISYKMGRRDTDDQLFSIKDSNTLIKQFFGDSENAMETIARMVDDDDIKYIFNWLGYEYITSGNYKNNNYNDDNYNPDPKLRWRFENKLNQGRVVYRTNSRLLKQSEYGEKEKIETIVADALAVVPNQYGQFDFNMADANDIVNLIIDIDWQIGYFKSRDEIFFSNNEDFWKQALEQSCYPDITYDQTFELLNGSKTKQNNNHVLVLFNERTQQFKFFKDDMDFIKYYFRTKNNAIKQMLKIISSVKQAKNVTRIFTGEE